MLWKISTIFFLLLLVASNIFWVFQVFDQGVTLMYREQLLYESAKSVSKLSDLASHFLKGTEKGEAKTLLAKIAPGDILFEKEGALHTPWISLTLNSEGLIEGVAENDALKGWGQSKDQTAEPRSDG